MKVSQRDELRAYLVEIWKALPDEDSLTVIDAVRPRRRADDLGRTRRARAHRVDRHAVPEVLAGRRPGGRGAGCGARRADRRGHNAGGGEEGVPEVPEPARRPGIGRCEGHRQIDPTEDGVALAFTELHRDGWRFDHDAGLWFWFDGNRWAADGCERAFSFCRDLSREASGTAGKGAKSVLRASFAAGVERMAHSRPRLMR